MSRVAVIEAPSILGLRPSGVQTLPDALLRAGLIDRFMRVTPDESHLRALMIPGATRKR